MRDSGCQDERKARRIKEWLLALLRFAFTLAPFDQAFVLALAEELDAFGCQPKRARSCFFFRTSAELCVAIENPNYPQRAFVLARFLSRISDPRLKKALTAATNVKSTVNSADPALQDRTRGTNPEEGKGPSCRPSRGGRRARPAPRTCAWDLQT